MSPSTRNIFTNIPDPLPEELIESIVKNDHLQLERIVSKGHFTPPGQWYDQPWDEWVLLLKGQATLLFENTSTQVTMKIGDYLLIPARTRHRVEWTHPEIDTIWLAVHYKQ